VPGNPVIAGFSSAIVVSKGLADFVRMNAAGLQGAAGKNPAVMVFGRNPEMTGKIGGFQISEKLNILGISACEIFHKPV
jgi:hypothetical protein